MEYLLTWSEGEEVNYKFLNLNQLRSIKLLDDVRYSLTNLKSGRQVDDVVKFIEEVA